MNSSSSHPLITKGTHIILDIYDINDNNNDNNEILKYESSIIKILDLIVEKFNLNVVAKAMHQFQPFGVTGVYVLSESHLSIHTFVEEKKVAMDLYTCNLFNRYDEFIDFVKIIFKECKCNYKIVER
jgi:S-adenosylmethionine decarboxylase proenzyme